MVEVTNNIPEDVVKLAKTSETFLNKANTFSIQDDKQYEQAGLELKSIKDRARMLDTERKLITKPMDEAKTRVMDFFRKPLLFLTDAEKVLKRSMIAYQDDKARKARIEEERLRRLRQEEQERLANEAETLEESGDNETANAVMEQAASMPEVIVEKFAPKVQGIKTTTRWSAEVTDKMALIKAVAAGEVSMLALDVNHTFLRQQAVSLKEAFSIAGVNVVITKGIAA